MKNMKLIRQHSKGAPAGLTKVYIVQIQILKGLEPNISLKTSPTTINTKGLPIKQALMEVQVLVTTQITISINKITFSSILEMGIHL